MSIQVKNITYIYNRNTPHETVALDDVSFEIRDGSFTGIIGHTGSGKSTLAQHLNGLLKPSSGQIVVGGTDITASGTVMRDIRKKVGLVFQYPEYQLFEETVFKDVAFGPLNLGIDELEVAERVEDALALVGLDVQEIGNRSPFDLSGGQKRRVAIAGVLAMKPEVLILDEPAAGLDPKAHKEILDMIQKVHSYENNIIIMISHNMDDIAAMSEQVIVMDGGRVVMNDTPAEVFSREKELKKIGLNVPEITYITNRMRERGLVLPNNILDTDMAVRGISATLKGRQK